MKNSGLVLFVSFQWISRRTDTGYVIYRRRHILKCKMRVDCHMKHISATVNCSSVDTDVNCQSLIAVLYTIYSTVLLDTDTSITNCSGYVLTRVQHGEIMGRPLCTLINRAEILENRIAEKFILQNRWNMSSNRLCKSVIITRPATITPMVPLGELELQPLPL